MTEYCNFLGLSRSIYVMVGLPGSGKSTIANNIVGATIYSSDKTRKELFGDEAIQGDPAVVFGKLYSDIRAELKRNKDAVIVLDATNINRKDRRQICEIGRQSKCDVIAIVARTPIEVCIERNNARERKVPESVIYKMVSRFEYPLYEEGFDTILLYDYDGEYQNIMDLVEKSKGFDQQNIHHTADLFNHMSNASAILFEKSKDVGFSTVGLFHDVGKLFTKTGPDENGNCHYFGHANWSAYLYLTSIQFDASYCRAINYHMMPYLYGWEKFKKKFANEPYDFIKNLEALHDADVNAH